MVLVYNTGQLEEGLMAVSGVTLSLTLPLPTLGCRVALMTKDVLAQLRSNLDIARYNSSPTLLQISNVSNTCRPYRYTHTKSGQ